MNTILKSGNSIAELSIYFEAGNYGREYSGTIYVLIGKYGSCSFDILSLKQDEYRQISLDKTTCPDLVIKDPELWWPW